MPTTDDQRDPAVAAAPVTDPDTAVPDTAVPDTTVPDTTVPDSGPQRGGQRTRSWRQLMMVVVAAIVLMLLIKTFVVQVYRIPSSSMEDTLLTGDRVLVNKLVYHVRGIARGDIVVFSGYGSWGTTTGAPDPSPPGNPLLRVAYDVLADIGVYSTQTYFIKRVIGLPGDHVVCCVNGKVTVNGVPLDEASYLFPGARPSVQPFNVIVPPGRLWVMGDNRAISDDSRGHMLAGFPAMGTHPGERGMRPGVHDHLAAVADWRPADSRHIPAGRAAHRGGGRGGLGPLVSGLDVLEDRPVGMAGDEPVTVRGRGGPLEYGQQPRRGRHAPCPVSVDVARNRGLT
jgi:signal peptidase I